MIPPGDGSNGDAVHHHTVILMLLYWYCYIDAFQLTLSWVHAGQVLSFQNSLS